MNKRRFVKEILQLLPTFAATRDGTYFYELPFEHVLAGFAWEVPRGYLYIWKYGFPLFEEFEGMHFGYGDRLPRPAGMISLAETRESEVASEFVQRIAPYRKAISKLRDLNNFLSYLESEPNRLENPVLRRGYALTFIMVGKDDEAVEQLKFYIRTEDRPEFRQSAQGWIDSIREGSARARLLSREEQFKDRFGIHGRPHSG